MPALPRPVGLNGRRPSQTRKSPVCPSNSWTRCGARSRNCTCMRVVHRSGGSRMWESADSTWVTMCSCLSVSSTASNSLKKSEAGGEMLEHPRIGWDFHDRGTLKALGLQYLHHAGTVVGPGVHCPVGSADAGRLEMHKLDDIRRQRLQFSQRITVRISSELVGGVRTQPQVLAFCRCETGTRLAHQQGHAANGESRILYRQDDSLTGRRARQSSHAQGLLLDVFRLLPGVIGAGGVNETQVRCLPSNQLGPLQRRLELLPRRVGVPGQTGPGHGEIKGETRKHLHQGLQAGQHWPPVLPLAAFTLAQAGLS